jgi:hypothetical protein
VTRISLAKTITTSTRSTISERPWFRRLRDRRDDYLRFAHDLRVPFGNNLAEVRHDVARFEWTRRKEGRSLMWSAA